MRSVLRIDQKALSPRIPELTVHRRPGPSEQSPIRFELTYGGAAVTSGWISGQDESLTVPAAELDEWMDDAALGLRAWKEDGEPVSIDGILARGEHIPTGVERKAAAVWSGFKDRNPARAGRLDLSFSGTGDPVTIYLGPFDLLGARRARLT